MHYLLLGLALLLVLLLGGKAFVNADPRKLARSMRKAGGYAALGMAVVFALTGRFPLAIPLAAVAMMLLGRGSGFGFPFPGNAQKTAGQESRVRTRFFEMTLDHDTGRMDGRVLTGQFEGRSLSDLDSDQLVSLWQECRGQDAQSAQLLEAYLDQSQPDWRATAPGAGRSETTGATGGAMTIEEAYEILGLSPGASEDQIRRAHRSLMKKLHPDQGGSTYLASKINEAKDLLLGT